MIKDKALTITLNHAPAVNEEPMNARDKTNTLIILTPEGIEFSLQLAGPITRCMAWWIDMVSISVLASLVNTILVFIGLFSGYLAYAIAILSYFVISIGYGIFFEWYWQGQTLGKKFLRLRVMDEQGLRLQFNQIVIRNLLRFVDSLPAFYLVGGMSCLISKRAQRLGDFVANTIVVWNPRLDEPDLDQLLGGKYNSFRKHPHLEARLRQHISPAEARIALQALVRRDEIEPAARVELFENLVSYFKSVVTFPPEATDGISDEQYIRNVVDALFRPKTATKTV
jgi:uncharacterized RDD family membrane protein YckC